MGSKQHTTYEGRGWDRKQMDWELGDTDFWRNSEAVIGWWTTILTFLHYSYMYVSQVKKDHKINGLNTQGNANTQNCSLINTKITNWET